MLSELNLDDNNELMQKDTVHEKQVEEEHLKVIKGYKKHCEELFGEIIDAI